MPYRDEEEALRARVEELEDELREREHEHAENDALKLRIAELERRPPPAASGGVAPSMARVDPGDLLGPPPLIDPRTAKSLVVAGGVTTLLTTILLPFFGIGELFVGTRCPPGTIRAYTRRYRLIRNGNKSDHAELRCVMADGKEVLGDETLSYLVSIGVGLALTVVLFVGFAAAGARRRRAAQLARDLRL